jgi:hypothetical protein
MAAMFSNGDAVIDDVWQISKCCDDLLDCAFVVLCPSREG